MFPIRIVLLDTHHPGNIGAVARAMKNMGLHTGDDLKKLTEDELTKHFGKVGRFYFNIVRGIDNREVQPHRETKSLAAEDTFAYDLTTIEEMEAELDKIAVIVCNRLQHYQLKGRTVTLKIKYSDFKQITRNQSFAAGICDLETVSATAKRLLDDIYSSGGSRDPEDAYVAFRGREPEPDALLRRRGLLDTPAAA